MIFHFFWDCLDFKSSYFEDILRTMFINFRNISTLIICCLSSLSNSKDIALSTEFLVGHLVCSRVGRWVFVFDFSTIHVSPPYFETFIIFDVSCTVITIVFSHFFLYNFVWFPIFRYFCFSSVFDLMISHLTFCNSTYSPKSLPSDFRPWEL